MNEAGKRIVISRVDGRKMASTLFEFLDANQKSDQHFVASLLEALAFKTGLHIRAAEGPKWTPEEVMPFERVRNIRIPFGIYHGKTLDSVPLDYLDWLCGEQEMFNGTLRAYLKHPALKDHIRDYERDLA
jgi:uncharacterized protein (DUF3820 family)